MTGQGEASNGGARSGAGAHPRRRRRRRPGKRSPEEKKGLVREVVSQARPPVDASKPADEPLSPEEAAKMRLHLRFLKENRKLLALKLNAAEDLLLNGVREPTHRGLCQHLLAKVERSRVEQVVPQLDPQARTRFLEGILGFAPEISHLLLYLEALKDSSRSDATLALAEALRHMDFAAVSPAQLRRLLELIVELHGEHDRPQLLFSLLQSSTFQKAFDRSAERFPQALADIVVPLRAAHAVVVRGGKNPSDTETLARGVEMLLRGSERVLRSNAPPVRKRLFDAGLELCRPDARTSAGLALLLDSVPKEERAHGDRAMALAGWLLASNREGEARSILSSLKREHPGFRLPARWLSALDAPRVGGIALADPTAPEGRAKERQAFLPGFWLARQRPVWVRMGQPADTERFESMRELRERIAVPGVAVVVAAGTTQEGAPYFAIPRLGRGGDDVIIPRGGLDTATALGLSVEAARILVALGEAGVALPDVRFRRFALDDAGRFWLRDLLDAKRAPPDEARAAHASLARELAVAILERSEPRWAAERVLEAVRAAEDGVALVRALEREL